MSKDFRIPNPLEFNDPFLLQRRRWKRSERRHIRRGAHGTLGYWIREVSENGHLPIHLAGRSSSMSELPDNPSLERAMAINPRPQVSAAGGGMVPKAAVGFRVDPAVDLQRPGRSFPHLLSRSISVPVTRSASQLDNAGARMWEGSLSGSESAFDSRSDGSSASLSYKFQPGRTISSPEERGVRAVHMDTSEEKDELTPAENCESAPNRSPEHAPDPSFPSRSSPLPLSIPQVLLPSPDSTPTPPRGCQLLDFFGENLAYIDESSDTPSDRPQPTASEEKRRRSRKPKRRSMRRQLSHRWSLLQVRRPSNDMRPPSNPPTPPPDSSLSDLSLSENRTDAATAL